MYQLLKQNVSVKVFDIGVNLGSVSPISMYDMGVNSGSVNPRSNACSGVNCGSVNPDRLAFLDPGVSSCDAVLDGGSSVDAIVTSTTRSVPVSLAANKRVFSSCVTDDDLKQIEQASAGGTEFLGLLMPSADRFVINRSISCCSASYTEGGGCPCCAQTSVVSQSRPGFPPVRGCQGYRQA